MKKHFNGLRSSGISAAIISLESTAAELKDIRLGRFNLTERVIRDIKDLIKAVFIDESH